MTVRSRIAFLYFPSWFFCVLFSLALCEQPKLMMKFRKRSGQKGENCWHVHPFHGLMRTIFWYVNVQLKLLMRLMRNGRISHMQIHSLQCFSSALIFIFRITFLFVHCVIVRFVCVCFRVWREQASLH